MTTFTTATRKLSIGGAALLAASIASAEIYVDEARVIDAQPVYESIETPVQIQECGYEVPSRPEPIDPQTLGDARAADPAQSIVGALRTDVALRESAEPVYRCHMTSHTERQDKLVGYRVRYQYGNRVYERQMDKAPGEWVRVRVRMSVGQPDLRTEVQQSRRYAATSTHPWRDR